MRRIDHGSATCYVFTYKEGLLSSIAHDLKISVTRFSLEIDEERRTLSAQCDPRSLSVVCAMRDGTEVDHLLSDGRERTVPIAIRRVGDELRAEASVHQPDFGIRPFSAILGTLRVRPDVKIALTMPWR